VNQPLICTILGFLLLGIGQISEAGWFGSSTYEDCILKSMKGVTSDRAAKAIEKACREKFPPKSAKSVKPAPLPKTPKSYPLPSNALYNITGKAGWNRTTRTPYYSGPGLSFEEMLNQTLIAKGLTPLSSKIHTDFAGTLYNKTDKWVITEITIKIEPKLAHHPRGLNKEEEDLSHICRTTVQSKRCFRTPRCYFKPKNKGTFRCPLVYTPKGEFEFNWNITEAKGYQLK